MYRVPYPLLDGSDTDRTSTLDPFKAQQIGLLRNGPLQADPAFWCRERTILERVGRQLVEAKRKRGRCIRTQQDRWTCEDEAIRAYLLGMD